MDCVNPDTTLQYFDLLNDVLEKYGLKTELEGIYDVDETGMPLDHLPTKDSYPERPQESTIPNS